MKSPFACSILMSVRARSKTSLDESSTGLSARAGLADRQCGARDTRRRRGASFWESLDPERTSCHLRIRDAVTRRTRTVRQHRLGPGTRRSRCHFGGHSDEHRDRTGRCGRPASRLAKYPAPPALATIGERWLRESRSSVLSVPSVIIPTELNFILNPAHEDFRKPVVSPSEPFSFDPRMWKTRN